MNWVVLVAVGWAVLLVAVGLLLGRAMKRRDRHGQPGRHRARAKPEAPGARVQAPPTPRPSDDEEPAMDGEPATSGDPPPSPVHPRGGSRPRS